MPRPKRKPARKPTGPAPETLHIEGDWADAVSHALTRGKPPADSPKKKAKKSKKER